VSAIDSRGRTIFVAEAHRASGKRFVVHAEELLTAGLAAVNSYAQVGKPQSTASVIPGANRFFFII
jgi:hypothetical protein